MVYFDGAGVASCVCVNPVRCLVRMSLSSMRNVSSLVSHSLSTSCSTQQHRSATTTRAKYGDIISANLNN